MQEADDLVFPDETANELLEEIEGQEYEVLIIVSEDSRKVDSENIKDEKLKNLMILDSSAFLFRTSKTAKLSSSVRSSNESLHTFS